MSDIIPPTKNDTGFHPSPGHLLLEVFIPDTKGTVILPDKVKDVRQPELEHVFVLEDGGTLKEGDMAYYPPGTRILVQGGPLINLVPGRKLAIARHEEVLGVFDK
jgi:hypothetical protein